MANDSNDVMVVEEKTKKKRAENIIIENYILIRVVAKFSM